MHQVKRRAVRLARSWLPLVNERRSIIVALGHFVRTFSVFGIRDDDCAVAAEQICAASPADARMLAERMFLDCAHILVWEASVLTARLLRVNLDDQAGNSQPPA